MTTRAAVADALFAKLVGCWTWGDSSRRLKLPSDTNPRPAIYLVELGGSTKRQGQLRIRTMDFVAVVYTAAPQADATVPADEQNDILDAIDAALEPGASEPGRQTLGGLCHWAYIDGETPQSPGDLDGDGRMVVPITVVLP